MTNPIRRREAASLLMYGEAWQPERGTDWTREVIGTRRPGTRRGWGRDARKASGRTGETCRACERAAGVRARIVPQRRGAATSAESKAAPREGGQEGGCGSATMKQTEAPPMSGRTIQGAEARNRSRAEATEWHDRMVSALGNGVTKGHWCSSFVAQSGPLASHDPEDCETSPMRKPPTGEPYAGKPPVRFGGRGG